MLNRTSVIVACTATAVGLLLAACSSGGGAAGGESVGTSGQPSRSASAGASLTAQQEVLAAATRTRRLNSAVETLTVHGSGIHNSTTTGTVVVQLRPALLISENLGIAAAGKTTQIKAIVTSTAFYLSEPALTSQVGKPWVKIDLSAMRGTALASLGQLFHSLQSNNFANQVQLLTVARNTRLVGKQMVDGASSTEFASSFRADAALKALPASFRQVLAPYLRLLGNTTLSFHAWIDGSHYLRRLTEVEQVNGENIATTINITAINKPVRVALPAASQTVTPPGM